MDEVSTKLLAIFQNVNEWLKFAEAKNGILLAFSGAAITATITLLATAQNIPNSLNFGLLLTTILLCICALICSLSFLPKIDLERSLYFQNRQNKKLNFQRSKDDNFWYFGDLQKYKADELLEALNKPYFKDSLDITKAEYKEYKDIATQITTNARIAFLKFEVFTYAVKVLIASILLIPCAMLISLVIYRRL
ncbi:hypothetical protein FJR38_06345 [Anabaena sp. UHCC 0253]|uniref:hypothetical protein n=1 Tax=Anabaena sp. UHCC 0253 TaxID=2590019 RepID=UPI001444A45B|nr:hypothetical protein [Anabaena sp. UHCC 0253]MTJ52317.1 hypothetical protein [Anabaena sp. UHCC 0253]